MSYKPETSWEISGNLIYNLYQKDWRYGEPNMVNDIGIRIVEYNQPLSPEDLDRIARVIKKALNEEFKEDLNGDISTNFKSHKN